MIAFLTALLAATSVSAQPIASSSSAAPAGSAAAPTHSRPYYMSVASKGLVEYALKYRKSDCPEAKASSIANDLVGSLLQPSGATVLVQSAVSYVAQNGPTLAGPSADQLAKNADAYYSAVHTQPPYKEFVSKVKAQSSAFDISKAVDDAHSTAVDLGGSNSEQANNIANKVGLFYSSVVHDPQGSAAVETGKAVASNVAKDFGVDPKGVKAKCLEIKANCKKAMNNN